MRQAVHDRLTHRPGCRHDTPLIMLGLGFELFAFRVSDSGFEVAASSS